MMVSDDVTNFVDEIFNHYESVIADEEYIELLLMTIEMHIKLTDSKEIWIRKFKNVRNVKVLKAIEEIKV